MAPVHLDNCLACRNRSERLRSSIEEIHRLVDIEQFVDSEASPEGECHDVSTMATGSKLHIEPECDPTDDPLLTGQVLISRYRVVHLLNSGGQGHVYLAQDFHLNRKVAIKIARYSIDENVITADTVISEGELLAKVNHPRVAHVYDCGVHAGRPYLVMEYVEGCTLKDFMQGNSISSRKVHKIIQDVAVAVKAIHAHGILHLDIKPENIMVTQDERCKLIDLGAAWFHPVVSESSEKIVGGTLEYMSPEQMTGTVSVISERTDVFGMGAVLFALLYGAPPGTDLEALDFQAHRVQNSDRSLKVDKDLKRICLKALNPDPAQRFSNARAFLEELISLNHRRIGPILICLGLACCLSGILSLACSSDFFDPFNIRQNKIPQERSFPTESANCSLTKSIKASVINASNESIQFCLWSERTGIRFFPATLIPEQQQELHELKCSASGVELHHSNEVFAVLALNSQFNGGVGDADLSHALNLEMKKLSTQLKQQYQLGIIQAAGAVTAGHQVIPVTHHTLSTNSPQVSGVIIHALAQQTCSTLYDIQLTFNDRQSPTCQIRAK